MLNISSIRAITLDLDDTLWPVWPTIHRAEDLLQDWLGTRAPVTAGLFKDSQIRQQLREQAHADLPHLLHDLSALRLEMIRAGLRRAGEDLRLAEPAFEVFFAARHEVSLFDDVLEALEWISQRYPVLAVSNGNADVHRVGIGRFFVGSVSARDAGVAKPDRRIFEAAARHLKLQPAQILHVGDDAALDVAGALAAGMQAAWVNREDHVWSLPVKPHLEVDSMAALCRALTPGGV